MSKSYENNLSLETARPLSSISALGGDDNIKDRDNGNKDDIFSPTMSTSQDSSFKLPLFEDSSDPDYALETDSEDDFDDDDDDDRSIIIPPPMSPRQESSRKRRLHKSHTPGSNKRHRPSPPHHLTTRPSVPHTETTRPANTTNPVPTSDQPHHHDEHALIANERHQLLDATTAVVDTALWSSEHGLACHQLSIVVDRIRAMDELRSEADRLRWRVKELEIQVKKEESRRKGLEESWGRQRERERDRLQRVSRGRRRERHDSEWF